jgi:hypothetical protein
MTAVLYWFLLTDFCVYYLTPSFFCSLCVFCGGGGVWLPEHDYFPHVFVSFAVHVFCFHDTYILSLLCPLTR